MPYKFFGTYQGYNVYKYPYSASARECPSDGNIYLVPFGHGYDMVLNGQSCGYCNAQYCVETFEEPSEDEVVELNFTTSSWTTEPNPQVFKEEKEEPSTKTTPAPASSSDFWTRVQEDIQNTLKSVSTNKEKPFKFDFK